MMIIVSEDYGISLFFAQLRKKESRTLSIRDMCKKDNCLFLEMYYSCCLQLYLISTEKKSIITLDMNNNPSEISFES